MSEPALSRGEEVNLLAWILERSQTHHVERYLDGKGIQRAGNMPGFLSLFLRDHQTVP